MIMTFPSPGDLPSTGIEPRSPVLQADSLPAEPPGKLTMCWDNSTISLLRAGANSDDAINSWVFTWDPEGAELGSVTRIHFRWDFLTVISDQGDG